MTIISITTTLKGFQQASRSVTRLSQTFRRMGQRATAVGRSLSLRLTAPLIALVGTVLKVADTWQRAFRDVEVATGATGRALEGLKASMSTVAKSVTINVGKVSKVIGDLNTLLGITGEELEDLSLLIINASQLLGEDAATNARLFAKAMNQFNEPLSKSSELLGQLFKITQDTSIGFGELLSQVLRQGPAFAPLNASLIEVADLLGRMNKAGIRTRSLGPGLLAFFDKVGREASKASEGIKKAGKESAKTTIKFISLVQGTKGAAPVFKEVSAGVFSAGRAMAQAEGATKGMAKAMGSARQQLIALLEKIKATPDQMQQIAIAAEKFGVDAAGAIIKGIDDILAVLRKSDPVIGKSADEINKLAREGITLGEAFQKIKNQMGEVLDILGKPLLEAFRSAEPAITAFIGTLRDLVLQFNALDPGTKQLIVGLGLFAIAIGPLLIALGLLLTGLGLLLSPVGLLIAGFTAIVVGVAVFSSEIAAAVEEAIAAVKFWLVTTFNNLKGQIINIARDIALGIQTWLVDKFNAIVSRIKSIINSIVSAWRRARALLTGGSIIPSMVSEIGQEFRRLDDSMVATTARQTAAVAGSFAGMADSAVGSVSKAMSKLLLLRQQFEAGLLTGAKRHRALRDLVKAGLLQQLKVGRQTFTARSISFAIVPKGTSSGGGFQTGGSRVFSTPSLVSVAETGPERLTGEPLAGGRRRSAGGNSFVFEGPVMFDELSLQRFGREVTRVLERERRRTV